MPVKPPAPRHTSEDLGNKLIISIPSLKSRSMTFLFGFWFICWAIGEFLIGMLLFIPDAPPIPIVIFMIILWSFIGVFMVYTLAWQVAGKEVIEVTNQSITIRRVALGLSSPKEYLADHIKELRVSASNISLNHSMLMWYGSSYPYPWLHHNMGSIAFDYGARTFRFGGVDEAEAKQILAEIQQKYPQIRNEFRSMLSWQMFTNLK